MALIILLIGCMVVGAASAVDDIAVNDINAPDDSMQLNAYGEYNINITTPTNITEDDNAIVSVSVTKDYILSWPADGYVKFQLDDQNATDYMNLNIFGHVNNNFGNLTNGTHTVKVTFAQWVNGHYEGFGPWRHWVDGYWNEIANETASFYVAPVVPVETNVDLLNVKDVSKGQSNTVTANSTYGVAGKYQFYIDGKPKGFATENNTYTIPNDLSVGPHTVGVVFTPYDTTHYKGSSDSASFKVMLFPEINATATPEESTYVSMEGNTVTITATLPEDATGNAKFAVWKDGDEGAMEYEEAIGNGVATLVLEELPAGNYHYEVYYAGDQNYTENTFENGSFVINKADPQFILEVFGEHPNVGEDNQDFGIYVKDNIFFFGNLPLDATGYVYFSLDGIVWYKAPVVNGIAKYEFGELPAGDYVLYAYYTGDDNYNAVSANTTFTVESPSPYVPEEPVEPAVPTMANTGNPLLVLFIALAGIGIGSLRRKL